MAEMVKIARGTSGQAELHDSYYTESPQGFAWRIAPLAGGMNVATSSTLGGWTVSESGGMVFVAPSASDGQYYLTYHAPNGDYDESWIDIYKFEVVCMTVEITATQTPEP